MVTPEVLEAVARLDRDPDFRVFMDEVQRRRDAARDSMEQALDLLQIARAQGASIFAGDLMKLARESPDGMTRRQKR